MSSLQTMHPDSESTIAGKTHSEILSMKKMTRCRWYKMLLPEEKEEAMRMMEDVRRAKISAAYTPERRIKHSEIMTGENNPAYGRVFTHTEKTKSKVRAAWTPEKRARLSAAMIEQWKDSEYRDNHSGTKHHFYEQTGENNPFYGKTHTEKTKAKMRRNNTSKRPDVRAKMRAAKIGKSLSEEHKANLSAAQIGRIHSEETKAKISAANTGENHPMYGRTGENSTNWKGGTSFLPYCPAFNSQLKESIRDRDSRTCALCGMGEIQNGERLSVHHIDADKMQGCDGKRWHLCALCRSCNSRPDTVEKEFLIVTNQNRIGGRR